MLLVDNISFQYYVYLLLKQTPAGNSFAELLFNFETNKAISSNYFRENKEQIRTYAY